MIRSVAVAAMLALSGCAAWVPMAISAAGGAMEIAKDGFDIKLDMRQMQIMDTSEQKQK